MVDSLQRREAALLASDLVKAALEALATDPAALLTGDVKTAHEALVATQTQLASARAAQSSQAAAAAQLAAAQLAEARAAGDSTLGVASGFAGCDWGQSEGKFNKAHAANARTLTELHGVAIVDMERAVKKVKQANPSVDLAALDTVIAAGTDKFEEKALDEFLAFKEGWLVVNTLRCRGEPVLSEAEAKRLREVKKTLNALPSAQKGKAGPARRAAGRRRRLEGGHVAAPEPRRVHGRHAVGWPAGGVGPAALGRRGRRAGRRGPAPRAGGGARGGVLQLWPAGPLQEELPDAGAHGLRRAGLAAVIGGVPGVGRAPDERGDWPDWPW